MKQIFILIILAPMVLAMAPHPQFVSLQELCPDLMIQMDYSTPHNFTGTIVPGYKAPKAYLARNTGEALCRVQKHAVLMGYSLKIFDAYRPVKAVEFFKEWAKKPEDNQKVKAEFYPTFSRQQLFEEGYIALRSSHSRGGAVDLTLHDLKKKTDVDMGGIFDYFHAISSTETKLITKNQQENRYLLKSLMEKEGFANYSGEWWHYSLKPEQFPDEYFDFDVE